MVKNNDKNIYLWFGSDDFTIAQALKGEKKSFAAEYGSINIFEVDWQDQKIDEEEKMARLQNGLMADSLFSSNKLLVVKNLLFPSKKGAEAEESERKDRKDEMVLKYLSSPRESVRIFFIESGIDKRKKTYKEFMRLQKDDLAELKEFAVPSEYNFEKWIRERIEKSGGKIGKDALNALSISLGRGLGQKDRSGNLKQAYDLWETNNEIEKLLDFCDGREIASGDIDLLVKSKVDMNIFSLIDKISSRNRNESVSLLNKQIEKGVNEIYILTMFIYQFRNLLKVKSLLESGCSAQEITSEAKMHPFVVRKSIQQCERFEIEDLKKIYRKLSDADTAIKTGKMEPRLVLDLLVVSIA